MFFIFFGLIIAVLLHWYFTKVYKYWDKLGILSFKKHNPYNEILQIALKKNIIFHDVIDAYNAYPEKQVYGTYFLRHPQLMVKDPEILRKICVKDFDHFINHIDVFFKDDVLFGKSLFALKGKKWRDMRSVLSPVFTGSKLRGICDLINECSDQTVTFCVQKFKNENRTTMTDEIDFFDICSRFTNDVIASAAFGIKINSLVDRNNEFFIAGSEMNDMALWRLIVVAFLPTIRKMFDVRFVPKYMYGFFGQIVEETIRVREEQNIIRYDMIHLLMEARKEQLKLIKDKMAENEDVTNLQQNLLTNEDLTAQAFVFFLGGFTNTALLMSFAAYELALQPDLQKRLQKEIDKVLKENNGQVGYNMIKEMKYLDMIVSETLRKWPPQASIDRECNKFYQIETNGEIFDVTPGTTINIPVVGLHYDPKYHENPEKFDPERFNDENKAKMNPYTYIPFGSGPRVCIAVRFVMLEVKAFLVHIFARFDVIPTDKTPVPMILADGNLLKPRNGFGLGLKLRE